MNLQRSREWGHCRRWHRPSRPSSRWRISRVLTKHWRNGGTKEESEADARSAARHQRHFLRDQERYSSNALQRPRCGTADARFVHDRCGTFMKQAMDIKPRPNRARHLETLRRMTPAQRLEKAFELTEFTRQVFFSELRNRFPDLPDEGLHRIALARVAECHNRNY